MIVRSGELLSRLGLAATVLYYSLDPGALSPVTISPDPFAPVTSNVWAASDAVTIASPSAATEGARGYARAALDEISVTKAILDQAKDFAGDVAFATYLGELDKAITHFESEPATTPAALWRLAGHLQSARSDLQNRVAFVAGWIAVMRCIEDGETQALPVPARFCSRAPAEIAYEQAPSATDIERIFEFDGILLA